METTRTTIPPAPIREAEPETLETLRSAEFRPRRSIWPRVMIAAVIAAGATALLVSHYYDDRSLGAKLDGSVAAAGSTVQGGVQELRSSAAAAAQGTANAAEHAADAIADASITASVKTALVADPSLSAMKIDVTTKQGAVVLQGPAPDEKSRQRAEVLAAAPKGVSKVENHLVVPGRTTAAPAPRAAPAPQANPVAAAPELPMPSVAPLAPVAPVMPVEAPGPVAPAQTPAAPPSTEPAQ
jgi:hyperosmotically inducible periplasmic protein